MLKHELSLMKLTFLNDLLMIPPFIGFASISLLYIFTLMRIAKMAVRSWIKERLLLLKISSGAISIIIIRGCE